MLTVAERIEAIEKRTNRSEFPLQQSPVLLPTNEMARTVQRMHSLGAKGGLLEPESGVCRVMMRVYVHSKEKQ